MYIIYIICHSHHEISVGLPDQVDDIVEELKTLTLTEAAELVKVRSASIGFGLVSSDY